MTCSQISYDLLRMLAENAFCEGDIDRARNLARGVDEAMLEVLEQYEGREISADEMPLIVPADRA